MTPAAPEGMPGPARRGVVTGRLARPSTSLLFLLVGTLVIRAVQLLVIAASSGAQLASGPRNPEGSPWQYFVFEPTAADPGLGGMLTNWDGQWYARIAAIGYPLGAEATSPNDAWATAFPPLFPLLARGVMEVSGLSFGWASLVLNTVLGLVAATLVHGLVRGYTGERAAVGAGLAMSLLPASPALVVAYSEQLALLLLLAALVALLRRHYLVVVVLLVGLALTRPIAAPFAGVVVVHAWGRWRREARAVPVPHVVGMLLAGALSLGSPWLWQRLATTLYGVPQREGFVGSNRTDEVAGSVGGGWVGTVASAGGPLILALFLLFVVAVLAVPFVLSRRMDWPLELAAWGVGYLTMILVVTPITPGIVRYLILATPLLAAVYAAPLRRSGRGRAVLFGVLVLASLVTQWWWIRYLYVIDPAPALLPWAP